MKRFLLLFMCFFIFGTICYSQSNYKITDVKYDISGCGNKLLGKTKVYALEKNVNLDTDKIFENIEELEDYLFDYQLRLNNLRAFETVSFEYKTADNPEQNYRNVFLNVKIKDSIHLLALPYFKYNSNTGGTFMIKFKDTNFLGTLNTLTADINFCLVQKIETEAPESQFGFSLNYDYPFKIGKYDATWTNDHSFAYTVGQDSPEWNAKTGIIVSFPFNHNALELAFYQACNKDFNYIPFGDDLYFDEEVKVSLPLQVTEIHNWGKVLFTPYIDFNAYWDFDHINPENTDLSGPQLTPGFTINAERVNWDDNFRNGLSLNLTNNFSYNFQRSILYPVISQETKYYKTFDLFKGNFLRHVGFNLDFYGFVYLIKFENPYFKFDGTKIGDRLRGIRDEQIFIDSVTGGWYACQTPSALILNLDFPIHIFSTNFTKGFMTYLNFDLQLSPFVDMALTYNKATQTWFSPKDGFYTAGVEVLVYPAKFSSFTIRGSIGIDVGRKFFSDILNTEWRDMSLPVHEISFGVGLHY